MAHIRRMLRGTDGRHHRAGGCGDDGTVRVRERSCACRVCMCARTLREHAREWVGLIMGLGDSVALPAQPIITII